MSAGHEPCARRHLLWVSSGPWAWAVQAPCGLLCSLRHPVGCCEMQEASWWRPDPVRLFLRRGWNDQRSALFRNNVTTTPKLSRANGTHPLQGSEANHSPACSDRKGAALAWSVACPALLPALSGRPLKGVFGHSEPCAVSAQGLRRSCRRRSPQPRSTLPATASTPPWTRLETSRLKK